jgi:hypothetical protein
MAPNDLERAPYGVADRSPLLRRQLIPSVGASANKPESAIEAGPTRTRHSRTLPDEARPCKDAGVASPPADARRSSA